MAVIWSMCCMWLWKAPCLSNKVHEDSSSFMPSCSANVIMTSCHEILLERLSSNSFWIFPTRRCNLRSQQIPSWYQTVLHHQRLKNFAVYPQLKEGCQIWSRVVSRYGQTRLLCMMGQFYRIRNRPIQMSCEFLHPNCFQELNSSSKFL